MQGIVSATRAFRLGTEPYRTFPRRRFFFLTGCFPVDIVSASYKHVTGIAGEGRAILSTELRFGPASSPMLNDNVASSHRSYDVSGIPTDGQDHIVPTALEKSANRPKLKWSLYSVGSYTNVSLQTVDSFHEW